jgi:D-beta-D-heptose 7-phosphate kinase/D-beta-D-heptose 1-phosphate adenosyltransferase
MRNSRTGALSIEKIKTRAQLTRIIAGLKAHGRRVVFTNGCFDILHYGHVRYLEKAKQQGDVLVVAVNSDTSVSRLKGRKRPIINQRDRLATVAALASVDFVVLFSEPTPLEVIKRLKPDVLVKGADWKIRDIVGSEVVRQYGGKVATVRLAPGRSTSGLIKKIAHADS